MSTCKRIKGIAHTDTYNPGIQSFSRVRCKMWQCPYCAKVNKRQWRAALHKQLPALESVWSFITLTVPENMHTEQSSAWLIKRIWDKTMKYMKRTYKFKHYVRVLEQHKDGTWHVHLIASFHFDDLKTVRDKHGNKRYSYSAGLKRVLPSYGWGNICSMDNLDTQGKTVNYVTKYMTKRDESFEALAKSVKIRIIQTSRSIKFQPEKSGHDWYLKSALYLEDIIPEDWLDMNTGVIVQPGDLDENGQYPHRSEYQE